MISILQQIRGQDEDMTDREDSRTMQPVVLRLSVTLRELDSAAPQLASDFEWCILTACLGSLSALPFLASGSDKREQRNADHVNW
jgi:hypothetical protein